jgi:hypothetical protein
MGFSNRRLLQVRCHRWQLLRQGCQAMHRYRRRRMPLLELAPQEGPEEEVVVGAHKPVEEEELAAPEGVQPLVPLAQKPLASAREHEAWPEREDAPSLLPLVSRDT